MNNKFNAIYSNNIWGGSGSGSKFTQSNKWFLKELRNYIDDNNIKYIADLGCGDWEIMKHFNFNSDESYEGIDCVDFLIDSHNENYSNDNIGFLCQDISLDVPSGYDLVIIKDVIQHWEDETILNKFTEILQKNKYVYCINGYKFIRDPSKNDWTNRVLDKKYSYHPIDFHKNPFIGYLSHIKEAKTYGTKQYILFEHIT